MSLHTVGIIPDTHLPFEIPGFLHFCVTTFEAFGVDRFVHIGDLVDMNAMSYHEHDPDGWSAGTELHEIRKKVLRWIKEFPNATWIKGNHDLLPDRQAKTAGIPKAFIRSWNEVLKIPHEQRWNMVDEAIIDDVMYQHGLGSGGKYGYSNAADFNRMSTVQGHTHSFAGIIYKANFERPIFGMGVGCGIDRERFPFLYAKYSKKKPIISCSVVVDGVEPHLITMDLGDRYKRTETGIIIPQKEGVAYEIK